MPNGDFEIGLTGWRSDDYGDINLVWETTGGAHSGQKCLHSLSGANPKAGLYSRPIPAHPGRHYTFSGRFKYTPSRLTHPRFEVLGCGSASGDGGGLVHSLPHVPTLHRWTQTTYSFTLPSTFASPSLCVHIGYPSYGRGTMYVDDVRLIATDDDDRLLALKDKITVGPQTWPIGNLYIYTPGATTATTVTISNTDTVAHNVTVQPTITDWEEKRVPGQPSLGTFSVPAKTAINNELMA